MVVVNKMEVGSETVISCYFGLCKFAFIQIGHSRDERVGNMLG